MHPTPAPFVTSAAALLLLAAVLVTDASAFQFTYGQRPITQDGRLFDVNPQLGSGGYNAVRPTSPLFGNASAYGNVGRGFALRSVQTIDSPTAFRAALGSAALSDFRRDSVSVADAGFDAGGFLNRPYFDPSGSVFTSRYLGFTQAGTPSLDAQPAGASPFSRPFPVPQAQTTYDGRTFGVPESPLDPRISAQLPQSDSFTSRATPNSRDALSARILGLPQDATAEPAPGAPPSPAPWSTAQRPAPPDAPAGAPAVQLPDTRIDPRVQEIGSALLVGRPAGQPLDLLLSGGDAAQLLDRRAAGLMPPPSAAAPQPDASSAPPPTRAAAPNLVPGAATPDPHGRAATPPTGVPTAAATPPVTPGGDLFSDIQMAVAYARDSNAAWVTDLKSVAAQHPSAALPPDVENSDPTAVLQSLLRAPVHSFVGKAESSLNRLLAEAEAYLRNGEFLKASAAYEKARAVDPANPLPLVGRAHALLAAGDYLTAAESLVQGLQRYPELARFDFDLEAFMGGETIDIRRADIGRRLEARDDATLRFLLGYIEYHSGHRESGLEHLRRAARLAPPGSFIQSFPGILTGERALPPPRLPYELPQRPALRDEIERPARRGPVPTIELERPAPIVREDPR